MRSKDLDKVLHMAHVLSTHTVEANPELEAPVVEGAAEVGVLRGAAGHEPLDITGQLRQAATQLTHTPEKKKISLPAPNTDSPAA